MRTVLIGPDLACKFGKALELFRVVRLERGLARHAAMVARHRGSGEPSFRQQCDPADGVGSTPIGVGELHAHVADDSATSPSIDLVDVALNHESLPAERHQKRASDQSAGDHDGDGDTHRLPSTIDGFHIEGGVIIGVPARLGYEWRPLDTWPDDGSPDISPQKDQATPEVSVFQPPPMLTQTNGRTERRQRRAARDLKA